MKPFRVLLQWMQRRAMICPPNTVTSPCIRAGGKRHDWSVSLCDLLPQVNIMLRLPSPVLSIVESYLGSKDKLNLRLTCKVLFTELPQHELPLYRPHFMPTSLLKDSFVTGIGHSLSSPLFPERFQPYQLVDKVGPPTRSSHSTVRVCMECNHYLPHSAVSLPTLVHCGTDQPILPMDSDHQCFYARRPTSSASYEVDEDYGVDGVEGEVFPQDAVFAVNVLRFNSPSEFTSTVFQCCSTHCFRHLAAKMCASPTPIAVIGQEITHVQKLENYEMLVSLRYFTYFSSHLSLLVDYNSTHMDMRTFRLRMENFHRQVGCGGSFTSFELETIAQISLLDAADCSQAWVTTCELTDEQPQTMLKLMTRFRGLNAFPETSLDEEEFDDLRNYYGYGFNDGQQHFLLTTPLEGGGSVTYHMNYSFAVIIHHGSTDWLMEAFVTHFDFPPNQIRALLRNLQHNLQVHYSGTSLHGGIVAMQDTSYMRFFEFLDLSCDESSVESVTDYDDLMEEEEEEEEEEMGFPHQDW